MNKTLVAYFSASGETARLAHTLTEAAQADLFAIEPTQPYTAADLNWKKPSSRLPALHKPSGSPAWFLAAVQAPGRCAIGSIA